MDKMTIGKSKPAERLRHSLTYGNLWPHILSLIKRRKEVYAYTLGDLIKKEFEFEPNRIMLYVVLYKLEHEGFIQAVHKKEDRRKYYALTAKGNDLLKFGKKYLQALGKRL